MRNMQDDPANSLKVKYGYGRDQKFNEDGQNCYYLDPIENKREYEIDNRNFMERQARARGIR